MSPPNNLAHSTTTSESKMADIARQKSKESAILQRVIDENNSMINTALTNRKELVSKVPQVDANVRGLGDFLQSLSTYSKKLTPNQRNRLRRSINNIVNAVGSLKKDLNAAAFDCTIQASALKYKNDGLKRDLNRRKI